jgi:hypothetical protein
MGDDNHEVEVILPARDIPDGGEVRKVTGSKVYKISDTIRLRGEGSPPDGNIVAEGGARFLVGDPMVAIWTISGDKKLVWITDWETLHGFTMQKAGLRY